MATGAPSIDGSDRQDPAHVPLAAGFPPADQDAWLALVDKVLKGGAFDRLVSRTDDGITVPPLYTRDASPGSLDEAGFPGSAPFTRGAHAAPRPHGLWDVRSVVDHPDPAEANRRALTDLERGVTSLRVAWGPASAADLDRRLEGVYLDLAPVVLEPGLDPTDAADALEALWTARGVDPSAAVGGFGADPLGVVAAHGAGGREVSDLLGDLGALAARTAARYPGVRAVTVSTLPAVEAGASEAQELAVLLSTGAAYLRAMAAAGLSVGRGLRAGGGDPRRRCGGVRDHRQAPRRPPGVVGHDPGLRRLRGRRGGAGARPHGPPDAHRAGPVGEPAAGHRGHLRRRGGRCRRHHGRALRRPGG